MKYKYAIQWAYIELVVALAMTAAVVVWLRPEWWGWLLFSPLFLYLVYEGVRKASYSLTVDGDNITIAGLKRAQYSVSSITAVHVWDAKGGRIAVVALSSGNRFNFPSHLDKFDELVSTLKTKANLP